MARGEAARQRLAPSTSSASAPSASSLNAQGTYVTFGHVTSGLDVLQKIVGLNQDCNPNDQTGLGGAPSRVVTVKTVTITES